MEARYGGTDVMERFCAVARGTDTNKLRSGGQRVRWARNGQRVVG
jgi:hypothetical protein